MEAGFRASGGACLGNHDVDAEAVEEDMVDYPSV